MDESMATVTDLDAFSSLANIQLPTPSRLVASSCCPDKDLVVFIQRLGSKDRLSLWKMQGSKKWEVTVENESDGQSEEIADIAWSPDGKC
jgi:anaphase-promoting complex subunit 4